MTIERRAVPGGVKLRKRDGDDAPGTVEGYAAVFHDDGDQGTEYELWSYPGERCVERVAPGAFARALREKDDCRCLRNHDPDQLLGRAAAGTLRLEEDARGLRYECDLPDTTAGRDTAVSVGRGDMTGSSFGFVAEQCSWRDVMAEDGSRLIVRTLEGVRLLDVSPVTYPAYDAASVGVRAVGGVEEARAGYERWRASQADVVPLEAKIAQARARAVAVQLAE